MQTKCWQFLGQRCRRIFELCQKMKDSSEKNKTCCWMIDTKLWLVIVASTTIQGVKFQVELASSASFPGDCYLLIWIFGISLFRNHLAHWKRQQIQQLPLKLAVVRYASPSKTRTRGQWPFRSVGKRAMLRMASHLCCSQGVSILN